MQRSTVINHRQHVGLQKLSALAGITQSCLGPNKKYKFIQDDSSGDSALVCSCFRILENLDLSCAVGQLVYETVQAHQKVYHTGSGCLLFLAGAWSRAALECLQRGISVGHIVSAMSEGMDICSDVCRKCSVSTEGLLYEKSETKTPTVEASQASFHLQGAQKVGDKTLNSSGQRKIKLSRHFYEAKSENVSTTSQHHQPDITHIAEGLSHGCVDVMKLVVEASRLQSEMNQQHISCSTLDVTRLVTCVLPGLSEEHACVLPGCVVLLPAQHASVAHHFKEQHLKVAVIHGDLSDTYRHLGFKRPTGVQSVSDRSDLTSSSREEKWMKKIVTLLLNLEVNLILVSGLVSETLTEHCCAHHILVVGKVKVSVLKAFADATGAVPVTYATQLTAHCVGSGVKVSVWRDLSSHERTPSVSVNISTVCENSELVTVVLTSCVQGKLQALEDQVWACAYRVHHMLRDKVLLPGAGVTEMFCVHHLHGRAEHHRERSGDPAAAHPLRAEVLHLMADGLIDYISTVMVNTGRFTKVRAWTAVSQKLQDCNQSLDAAAKFSQLFLEEDCGRSDEAAAVKIFDNLSVKQEAWRKALDLVLLVLQTDAELITGSDHNCDDLMLL